MEPTSSLKSFDTAVFVDLENLVAGYTLTEEQMKRLDLKAMLTRISDLEQLVGRYAISRAYANWQSYKLAPLTAQLAELGMAQAHVQAIGLSQKNLCDIALATDVMDVLHTRPNIRTFVIVSGDGGFAWLVRRLNEYGKNVVVAAYESQTNRTLRELANVFLPVDDPREKPEADAFYHPDPVAVALLGRMGRFETAAASLGDIQAQVRKVFAQMPEVPEAAAALEAGLPLTRLRIWLDALVAGFNEHTQFGYLRFPEFVRGYAGSSHYILEGIKEEETKLYFRRQVAGAPSPQVQLRVSTTQLADKVERPFTSAQKTVAGAYAVAQTLPQAKTMIARILQDMAADKHFDFDAGVPDERVVEYIRAKNLPIKPYTIGVNGLHHLCLLAAEEAEMAVFEQDYPPGRFLFAYDYARPRDARPTLVPQPNEKHSVANYLNAAAENEASKWFFVLDSPDLTRFAADYLTRNASEEHSVSDWVRMATEPAAAIKRYGALAPAKLKGHVQNTMLAYNAAAVFDKKPESAPLLSQTLKLKPELGKTEQLLVKLREKVSEKIEKVLEDKPKPELVKQITG